MCCALIQQSEYYDSGLNAMALVRDQSKLVVGSEEGTFFIFNWGDFGYHVDRFCGVKEEIHCILPLADKLLLAGYDDGNIRYSYYIILVLLLVEKNIYTFVVFILFTFLCITNSYFFCDYYHLFILLQVNLGLFPRAMHLYPHRFVGIIGEHRDFGVSCLVKSRDGKYIASCSMDGLVRFWNIDYLYRKKINPRQRVRLLVIHLNYSLTYAI